MTPAGESKSRVTVQHQRLPDAATAASFKQLWRERLVTLKSLLEASSDR